MFSLLWQESGGLASNAGVLTSTVERNVVDDKPGDPQGTPDTKDLSEDVSRLESLLLPWPRDNTLVNFKRAPTLAYDKVCDIRVCGRSDDGATR